MAQDNVTEFKKPEPRIWICECGCASFSLVEDGSAECAMCGGVAGFMDRGGWSKFPAHQESDSENVTTDIHGNGSVEFAKMRIGKLASDDDCAMVVVAKEGGSLHTWSMAGDQKQYEWALEKLTDAMDMIGNNIAKKGNTDAQ